MEALSLMVSDDQKNVRVLSRSCLDPGQRIMVFWEFLTILKIKVVQIVGSQLNLQCRQRLVFVVISIKLELDDRWLQSTSNLSLSLSSPLRWALAIYEVKYPSSLDHTHGGYSLNLHESWQSYEFRVELYLDGKDGINLRICMLRPQVPKFGNWESEEDVPYTAYFEKAKKDQNGKMKPQIPDPSSNNESSFQSQDETEVKSGDSTKFERERPKDASRTKLETRVSREEINLIKSSDSPTRPKQTTRQSVGSDQSIDNSPMHPHQQPRVGNRASAGSSPMWDRKVSSEGINGAASSTPGRSRLKQVTRGEETVDDGPAIPKFGDWDDNDPTAGEGYTQLFNKAREDRHNGGSRSPMITTENANFYGQNRHGNDNSKGCGCFPWSRK
ncbi:hypothetical protein L6452_09318 [Arctium lappa]|uniref:Uncharacterized protein n=1 Tax=Arctium lappa TaxID=4217 RepID=A0ACB9DKV7_ARCLA|nr:hypothetical protein L6452_09318 [Arctium lappa]